MPIYRFQMPDGSVGRFEVPEGMSPEKAQSLISQDLDQLTSSGARDYTVGEAASKALTRGTKQIGSAFGDVIPAMIGKSLGFDEYAKEQMGEARATQQEIAEKYAPEVASYKDVKGLGSAATYGLETVLEQLPNLATSIVPGGIGAQIGRRAAIAAGEKALAGEAAGALGQGLTKEESLLAAQRLFGPEAAQRTIDAGVSSGVKQGAGIGLYLGSYAQNAPEIFQNIYENTGKLEPGAAAIAGTAAAALDTALPAYILNKFAGPARALLTEKVLQQSGMQPSLARAAIATLPEAAGLEGLTEAAQEAISIEAEKYVAGNKDKFTSEQWNRIMESGVKGAVAGLGFGAPSTVATYARQKMDARDQQVQDQQALELQNQAALEGSDVIGLTGAANERVDREGLGADLSVPEQPVQQKVSRKSKRAVEPRVVEPTESVGGPDVGTTTEPVALTPIPYDTTIYDPTVEGNKRQESGEANIIDYGGRKIVLRNINGVQVPFYLSTGSGGKKDVPAGKWYPFFGVGTDGWINKTGGKEMANYYNSAALRQEAELLDSTLGDVRDQEHTKVGRTGAHIDAINAGFTPSENNTPETLNTVRSNIDNLIKQLDEVATSREEAQTSTEPKAEEVVKSNLTDEAEQLIASELPEEVTEDMRRIAKENGIPTSKNTTPAIVVQALQDKRDSYMAVQEQQQAEREAEEDPFSKVAEVAETGETAETIGQTLRDEFGSNVDLARKRGLVNIVNNAEELSEEARAKLPPNAVGIFHKGVSHIIANRIDKPGARKALLHELGEHYGLEGMIGKDLYKQVLRQVKNLSLTDPTVKAAWAEVTRLYPELKEGSEAHAREVLARVGESAPNNSLWRKIVGAVKNFLTKMGLYNPNKMTTADIQDLILHSLRTSLKKGEVKAADKTQMSKERFTPAFKKWFGNSKAVNKDGSPKVVYHGTNVEDFNKFKPSESGLLGPGIYMTDKTDEADNYAGMSTYGGEQIVADRGRIIPVYVSLQNPFYSEVGYDVPLDWQKQGYDGVIFNNKRDGKVWYVAAESKQIKSAVGNRGTYSPESDNILYSKQSTAAADPKMAAAMLQSVGDTVKNLPALSGELGQGITDALSRAGPGLRKIALSFMSLPNKVDLYGHRLPQLKELQTYLEQRASRADQLRSEVDKATFEYMRVLNRHPSHITRKFNKITTQLSAANIDPRDVKNENDPLVQAYKNLPKDLQKLGTDISDHYASYSNKMLDLIEDILSIKPGTKESLALRERFEKNRLSFYHPLRRKGNYWMSYLDKDGEMQIIARESPAERARAKKEAEAKGGKEFVEFTRLQNADYKSAPPVGFIKDVINILDKQLADVPMNEADKDGIKNQVYQTYLDLLPAEALRQQFREREGIPGYIEDIVGGFADTGAKLANQLSNLEYRIKIDSAVSDLQAELGIKRGEQATDLEELTAVVQDVVDQKSFLNNPVADTISSRMGWVSYMWNIAGNISSAIVNMTQLLMVVYPMLAGRYGLGKATSMMMDAAGRYFKGGLDHNREFMPDWTFGANLKEGDKYYNLYQSAIRQSAIRRGVGYELTELRRRTAEDFTGTKAKVETALGWVFQNTERMNREITIMAAYDLARQAGKTENQAIEEALDLSNRVHSHALSEAGPKMFQTGFGKVAFTFKRFAQQQIYNVARLGYLAFKDLNPEERKVARAQLMGIMGATYVFSGVQGLPLYGAANMLASAMAAMFGDDDEPYDFDEEVRRSIGMLGYKGPLNLITNIDIASRTGFNGMIWRDDPRRLAEVGFGAYFAEHFFGPAYQALLINPQRAEELWTQGQTSKAIETVLPAFAKNPIKAMRFATEGALTSNGAPIVDDISAYSAFMQIFGFSNAELSEAYARAGSMKTAEKAIQGRRTALLDLHFLAKNAGDTDMLAEIDDKIQGYNESYPQNKISRDTLNRSYRGHMQRIEDSVNGVYLNKKLKAQLMEAEYGDELPD